MKIKILFPIIWNIWNESNDCLYKIAKTIVANRGLNGEPIVKKVIRGMYLKEKPKVWDDLAQLQKADNWFSTKKSIHLDQIRLLVGYFLRCRASHFCQCLNNELLQKTSFENMNELLLACNQTIKPVVIEFKVTDRTSDRFKSFVHLSGEMFKTIKGGEFVSCSNKTTMYKIKPEYEELAWNCLDRGDTAVFESLPTPTTASNSISDPSAEIANLHQHLSSSDIDLQPIPISETSQTVIQIEFVASTDLTSPQSLSTAGKEFDAISETTSEPIRRDPLHLSTRRARKHKPVFCAPKQIKKRVIKRVSRSTRSQRPSKIPHNTTFEWIAMNGYPYRPAFIHSAKPDVSGVERAQVITAEGELGQKLYEFTRVDSKTKTKHYVRALQKFNFNYRTQYE